MISAQANKAVVRRCYDVCLGAGDFAAFDEVRALEYHLHLTGSPDPMDCEAAKQYLAHSRVAKDISVARRPSELDRALEHRGLPSGNVALLLGAAADVLAAWERAGTWEEWDAWSRSEAGAEAMAELEAALETFAPAEGEG